MEAVVIALITAGGIPYLIAAVRWLQRRRAAATPAGQRLALLTEADQTVAVVAHARDELAEDNRRLRVMLAEERKAHADDNAAHYAREASMRSEIDALELKLRTVLTEVEEFKRRHR